MKISRVWLTAPALAGLVLVAVLAGGGVFGAASRPAVKDFLPKLGFVAADLAALDRGEAVTHIMKAEIVDWRATDVGERVNAFARERLLAVTTSYGVQGTAAFLPLEDNIHMGPGLMCAARSHS